MDSTARAAIVGVTGFIGHGLPPLFAARGIATTGISRSGGGSLAGVDRWATPEDFDFADHRIVVNLAGEPIDQRWTERKKREFRESRVGVTLRIVENLAKLPEERRPQVLVNGSAVGIYGDRGDEILPETAKPGAGFLAELCKDWEHAAGDAESLGLRVVTVRTGVVLGERGGALERLLPIFRMGIGGRLGSGEQWMPWIHLRDLRRALVHAALSDGLRGPVNGCAPAAERNADFTRKLADALHRPALLPSPRFALRLVLGEFATALIASQHAVPTALENDGFAFDFPTLKSALAELL